MHRWVRIPSHGPNNLYVYEPQQYLEQGLSARKSSLMPPSNLLGTLDNVFIGWTFTWLMEKSKFKWIMKNVYK